MVTATFGGSIESIHICLGRKLKLREVRSPPGQGRVVGLRSESLEVGLSSSRAPSLGHSSQPPIFLEGWLQEQNEDPLQPPFLGRVRNTSPSARGTHLLRPRLSRVGRRGRPSPRESARAPGVPPKPKNWAEGQPFPCQRPEDLPIRELWQAAAA